MEVLVAEHAHEGGAYACSDPHHPSERLGLRAYWGRLRRWCRAAEPPGAARSSSAAAGRRKGDAALLGGGGWLAGALIVLTALPTVPLDDELLAALSAGVPVGLGVYFAWVHRDWSANTRWVGFAAATGGAFVGAWLGFNALDGLFALVATVVGAVLGANVTLLGLDVAWDSQARDRTAPATAEKAPASGLLPGQAGSGFNVGRVGSRPPLAAGMQAGAAADRPTGPCRIRCSWRRTSAGSG